MKNRKVLVIFFFVSSVFSLRPLAAQPIVQSARQVSPDDLFDAGEVSVAIDHADPNLVAAGSNPNYFYYSTNRGLSWQGDGIASSFGEDGDPWLTGDSKGSIYYAHLSYPASTYWLDRIVIQKSADGGRTYSDGSFAGVDPQKQQVKGRIACDLSPSSPYHDNLYLCWTEFDVYPVQNTPSQFDSSRILFSRSIDGGQTWSDPIQISDRQGDCGDSSTTDQGSYCTIGPKGEVYVCWAGPDGILFDKSTDGGKTFGTDKIVTSLIPGWRMLIDGTSRYNSFPSLVCDIGNSKGRGNLYLFFSDLRNGPKNADIFMVRSSDGGSSWSQLLRVNDDTTTYNQFLPAAAIDQTNGVLYSVFYDRRNTNGTSLTDVYLARSDDGGLHFTNYRLTVNPVFVSVAGLTGDYIGIAADSHYVYPIWTQNKQTTTAIYTAPVVDTEKVSDAVLPQNSESSEPLSLDALANPVNTSLHLHLIRKPDEYCSVILTDMVGRTIGNIYEGKDGAADEYLSFDCKNIPGGMYYAIAQSSERRTVIKIVISH